MPFEMEQQLSQPPEPPRQRVTYDARVGDVAAIAVTNGLLSLITLGIYRFWGKTRLRRYLWGHISFLDDRLEYSGRAMELLIGFIVALVILAPLIGASFAFDIYFAANVALLGVKSVVELLVLFFLIQFAIYRARRYRLSRTQWRGIRAGQGGSATRYALISMGWGLLVVVTFYLAYPLLNARLQKYRTENTWFGDRQLEFDGKAGELFGSWVIAWLLFYFTFGISFLWYRTKEFRYFASKTRYGNIRFESKLTTMQVFLIYLFFMIAVGATLAALGGAVFYALPIIMEGLAINEDVPLWAMLQQDNELSVIIMLPAMVLMVVVLGVLQVLLFVHPFLRVLCNTLTVVGEEDYAAIAQSQQSRPGRGEGLADTLDVGAI